MNERELKVLWRGGAVLALASLARVATGGPVSGSQLSGPSVLDSLLVASRSEQEGVARRSKPLAVGETIDPNAAGVDELARLPRVGPALAARIVQEREAGGPFVSLADLQRVRGIGPRLTEGLEGLVTLSGGGAVAASVKARRGNPVRGPPGPTGVAGAAASPRIDINRSSAEELMGLPGVGPVLAERIVTFRGQHGRFRTVNDLVGVRGIGEARLQDIKAALGKIR